VLVLAFDTSTPLVTVAVVDTGGHVVSEHERLAPNKQGELLAPLIHAALADAGAAPDRLGALGVGLGPGPFTGLRVGVVSAAVMADALQVPAHGTCSLDAVLGPAGGDCLVITDARRRQVYWARYDEAGHRVEGPELGPPAEVADRFRGAVPRVAGAGAVLYRECFADFVIDDDTLYPRARTLGLLAAERAERGEPGGVLTPMYLRRPDAQPPGPPKRVTPA
jgi:tRNA threonylcarbamoyl adenosine modification protein YeaZ